MIPSDTLIKLIPAGKDRFAKVAILQKAEIKKTFTL